MEKWIDTHAHYNHGKFCNKRTEILDALPEFVEKIIQVGTNRKTNMATLNLASLYDYIYGMVGYFPTDVWELEPSLCADADENWIVLKEQLTCRKIVGIGEIGLDYNWNKVGSVFGDEARILQKKWFRKQLDLAQEMKMPVSIHSRDAKEDTLNIFEEYKRISGVVHCFSYDRMTARCCLDKGLCLGIGGTSTYPSNKEIREVIKMIPMDRILLETDAPYLSPQPVRKQVNNSEYLKYVIENIQNIKGVSFDFVIEQTNQNAKRVFDFSRGVVNG